MAIKQIRGSTGSSNKMNPSSFQDKSEKTKHATGSHLSTNEKEVNSVALTNFRTNMLSKGAYPYGNNKRKHEDK